MYEYHDVPTAGHPGREKTYSLLTRDFYWNHQYKRVRKYVRTCDVCQQVKPAPHSQAPLQPLPTPSECWESISMDFVFGLPRDSRRKTGIVVFVDRFSKMVHLAAVAERRRTGKPNRVLVDLLKSYAQSFHNWSDYLPMAEFAINNAVHASTEHTPFFVNAKTADTDLSAAMTRARARARTRQGDVSVPGTDTVKDHEQETPASIKDNVDVSMPGIDTEKLHAQAGPDAITHEVPVPGADTPKSHAQSGTDAVGKKTPRQAATYQ
ncbi:Inositol-3-phosphate synthase [Phytophthora megakarya]|uniref:Inositol-3-phosphate synthase n=1 Tax=Phytophthora megakarya TaxID=4795 RepID=A0A225UDA1_9STRA|nr:Inositol-3-phosphate synthase [Phytophthora megakarya]